MSSSDPGEARGEKAIQPEVEIAWARAVSRAFDDPAFYRRLKAKPVEVLTDLGADLNDIDLKHEIGPRGRLHPKLTAVDKVFENLADKPSARSSAEPSTYQAPCAQPSSPSGASGQAVQSGMPTSIHVHVPGYGGAFPTATGCMTVHTYASSACVASLHVACIAASQVATTRPTAAPGDSAPQWIGGPPSGGGPRGA